MLLFLLCLVVPPFQKGIGADTMGPRHAPLLPVDGVFLQDHKLTVSDIGISIPAEHKDRFFERFCRVDKSHFKASGGTGLGLSIVKHAAVCHNAETQLDSTPGKGTTITVRF